jgi:hypothetical protein
VRGKFQQIRVQVEQRRQERRLVREFHAASPRVQEDLLAALQRSSER